MANKRYHVTVSIVVQGRRTYEVVAADPDDAKRRVADGEGECIAYAIEEPEELPPTDVRQITAW